MPAPGIRIPRTMLELLKSGPGIRNEYLKVSEGGVYQTPTLVKTVLGSCLGAAFHAPTKGIGAFFHAFLPYCADYDGCLGEPVYKFVDAAIDHVISQFERLGVKPALLKICLIGGANGLGDQRNGVGLKNVEAAYKTLEKYHLRPGFAQVGGERGRKVIFLSSTGELGVSVLTRSNPR